MSQEIGLHRTQIEFFKSRELYRGFVGGRGVGKSWIGAFDLIARAKEGRTYLVAAPTYPMLQDSSLRSFLHVGRQLGVIDPDHFKRSPPPSCRLLTEAEVIFRSADDPERLRGPNLSGAWLDEASLMHRDAYDIVIACLREGGEKGWLSATFTPKGTGHWTYELWGLSKPNTALFHAKTQDNPFLPADLAQTLAEQYGGFNSNFARQELGGEFVNADDAWQLIPTAWVQLAQARWTDKPPKGQRQSALGVDVARGGADSTVIIERWGSWFSRPRKYQGPETDDGPKAAALALKQHRDNSPINVDAIGVGSSCIDSLRGLVDPSLVNGIMVGNSPVPVVWDRARRYRPYNVRAAMYWKLMEALDPEKGEDIALPPDKEVLTELTALRYEPRGAYIYLEKKDAIKERLGHSPDCADAIALAFWNARGYSYGDIRVYDVSMSPAVADAARKTEAEKRERKETNASEEVEYIWPADTRRQSP